MQRGTIVRPLAELVAMSVLLTSYIWGWADSFQGALSLCVILYACIGLASHLRAGEGPADIGLRLDNLGAATRNALLVTMTIGLFLVGAGALLGGLDFPPLTVWPLNLWDGIVWGTIQQYGLLCFYYRRFSEILPRHICDPLWPAGAVFALLHLPNPFLTLVTFGAGVLSCWLYRQKPNLIVLGVMHGVVSFLIVRTLPGTITLGMKVGPGFLRSLAGR